MNKKLFYILFTIIIVAAVVYVAWFWFGDYYYSWRIGYQWKNFEREWNNYFKNDKFGGATPEETYKMFVNELKRGNIENASQYFYWEKQIDEQDRLQKMKDEGKLEEYINNLPKWSDLKEEEYSVSDERQYSYQVVYPNETKIYDPLSEKEITFPAGIGKSIINFQLNKQANIWKIYSL